jgi:hypothetical protein
VHSPSDVLAHLDLGYVHQVGAASMAALCYFSQAYEEGSGVGIKQNDPAIAVAPNPFDELLRIRAKDLKTCVLMTAEGANLYSFKNLELDELQMDTSGLPDGIYLLKLEFKGEQQAIVRKLVKMSKALLE